MCGEERRYLENEWQSGKRNKTETGNVAINEVVSFQDIPLGLELCILYPLALGVKSKFTLDCRLERGPLTLFWARLMNRRIRWEAHIFNSKILSGVGLFPLDRE